MPEKGKFYHVAAGGAKKYQGDQGKESKLTLSSGRFPIL